MFVQLIMFDAYENVYMDLMMHHGIGIEELGRFY